MFFRILAGKSTRVRPLGRSRRGLEDNVGMDIIEISVNTRNWVDSAHDRDY